MGIEETRHMSNAERSALTVLHKKQFIELYPTYGTVGQTCKQIGVERPRFYEWLKDEEFNAIYQSLKLDRIDEMVTRLYDFVLHVDAEKMNQQQILACFFLLKSFDPKTFSEKMQLQHTGADGKPVKVTTVEIHRAEKPDGTRATAEDLKETVENGNSDSSIP